MAGWTGPCEKGLLVRSYEGSFLLCADLVFFERIAVVCWTDSLRGP